MSDIAIPDTASKRTQKTERVDTFNPDEYETVAQRIKRFWRANKEGRIATEIHYAKPLGPDGRTQWVVKASVWRAGNEESPDATGFAVETDGVGDEITANAALEVAETSAIGRALANLGLTGSKPRSTREGVARTQKKIAEAKP